MNSCIKLSILWMDCLSVEASKMNQCKKTVRFLQKCRLVISLASSMLENLTYK